MQTNDDLDRLVNDKIHELIFSKETEEVKDRIDSRTKGNILRLGNPIAGDIGSIRGIKSGLTHEFYKKFYRPSNMVISITSDKNLDFIKSLVKTNFVNEPLQLKAINEEISISDGYSKIYEILDDSERYEKELISKLIDERKENLNIAEDKQESIKNNTHIYDLINQSCNEHEVESEENRRCCDIIKAAEQTEEKIQKLKDQLAFDKRFRTGTCIAIGFKTCNTYCIDRFALEMLSIILAGNMVVDCSWHYVRKKIAKWLMVYQ